MRVGHQNLSGLFDQSLIINAISRLHQATFTQSLETVVYPHLMLQYHNALANVTHTRKQSTLNLYLNMRAFYALLTVTYQAFSTQVLIGRYDSQRPVEQHAV